MTGRGKVGINAGFLEQSGPNLIQDATVDGFEMKKLFDSAANSLALPIKPEPDFPWETDLSKWVKVPWSTNGEDIGEALQGAIDQAAKEGKTTVYSPRHARP